MITALETHLMLEHGVAVTTLSQLHRGYVRRILKRGRPEEVRWLRELRPDDPLYREAWALRMHESKHAELQDPSELDDESLMRAVEHIRTGK